MDQPFNKPAESDAQTRAEEPIERAPGRTSRPSRDPEHIGPYRILERMGEGGMGVVYKAEQREPVRRVVALKVIKLGMDTREVVARFEAERQALALMSHPNVAKVFEAGATEHGRPYFAMEFVPGIPLTDYCDENKLTTRHRLELFIAVCQAVQHAHQKGIIHRDLKPSNVLVSMFDGQPIPKVIDFGIAKAANQALTEKTIYTQTGSLIGTPEYMSPEQAQTSGLDVDTRTDVYSLGVILYELLTGQLPFNAKELRKAGPDGIARMIRETEPAKPSTRLSLIVTDASSSHETPWAMAARKRSSDLRSLQRELRGDLDWITLKSMEKDRTRRYETPSALAADIRRYLDSEPISAHPPSTLYRLGKVVHRHKLGVTAAGFVLLALLLGVIGTTTGMVRARHATARALSAEREAREQAQIAERETASALENEAVADHNIARMLQVKGDFAAADPMLRRALDIYRKLRGPEHADVAIALAELAHLQQASGNFAAAEQTFNDSLHIFERLDGQRGPRVAYALDRLGAMYLASNRAEVAEPLLRQSLDLFRVAPGSSVDGLASTLGDLGMLLYRKGNAAVAEPLLRESLSTWQKFPGYESLLSYDIAAIAQSLLQLHESSADRTLSMAYYRQYMLIQIAHISMGIAASPNDSSFLHARADMYARLGLFPQMAADLDKMLRLTPDDHLLYMQCACVHLYLGEESAYRDVCQRMLHRFDKSSDARVHDRIAKTCLAGAQLPAELASAIQIARANIDPELLKTVPGARDLTALFRLCAAMAEYRAGNDQKVCDLLDDPTMQRLSIEPRATALLFLAMANHRQKKDDEARSELAQTRPLYERISAPTSDVIEPNATIQDWLIAQTTLREADAVLKAL